MEIIICPDEQTVGRTAARRIAHVASTVTTRPFVFGVATGSSPLATYQHLATLIQDGSLDLSTAKVFALDEYVGLPAAHPQSYEAVIARTVTEPLGLDPDNVHSPNGFARDLERAARDYENAIATAGGIDVQILGIGSDGHIGFNEPGSSLRSRTRIKTLTEATRRDNARFFPHLDDVPRHCLTQGLGTISDAREIVLVAHGATKAAAVAAMVEGPVSASCPGSVLQFHEHTTVVVDEEAASELTRAAYYRQVYDQKPQWQKW